jgi:uncharacterized protein (TIGR02145 family)
MIKFKKNKKNKKNKKAFSFMELLTTIIIIGIIISTATISFTKIRENSRDTKRIADIKQIQSALELYYSDNGKYPETLGTSISSGTKIYLEKVPESVTPADGDCSEEENSYSYSTSDENNNYYYLNFCLGKEVDDYKAGKKIAVSGDILEPIDLCGQDFKDERDNKYYSTVRIGDQCWMAENLNIGTRIDGVTTSTDNDIIEKYCYGNLESNCDIYGGLYQWDETVQYEYEEVNIKGICPDGWHVPSDAEWTVLTDHIKSNPNYLCNGNQSYIAKALASSYDWNTHIDDCAIGNNLLTNNATGFNALPADYRYFTDGGFHSLPTRSIAYFWSSSPSNPYAHSRRLSYNSPEVHPSTDYRAYGFSVRCIKD